MSQRVKDLQDLVETTRDLSDADLNKLVSMARYMRDAEGLSTKDPLLDLVIGTFRQFAESKGSVLYAVLFRKAGIGLQFWEEERAGPPPQIDKSKGMVESLQQYNEESREWTKRGLVIYGYYPILSEAISREWSRLEKDNR